MNNIIIICQKELKSYFVSPIAYGLMAFFALISGYFFYIATGYFVQGSMQAQMMGRQMPMSINEQILRPVLMNLSVVGLFLIPMITMRLFAQEKSSGTIELLVTSPIHDLEIIIGKWLGALLMYATIVCVGMLSTVFVFVYGKPDWKPVLVGLLGLLLQGGCLLALGTFISNTTKSQIVAGVATFGVCLMLWILDWISFEQTTFSKVVAYLSVVTHFEPFAKGVIDSKDVIFYISMIVFGLFLTSRSMESLRWRS